ncbi:hypothetical protein TNCV_993001 [Trichonephila clavipes]|nr:hypothetical protein TNCV_993001 [Trichonephila clavipes]
MDVGKCIVPLRQGGTLNSPQGVLSQNWGGTEPNRTVTCTVLEATAKDRSVRYAGSGVLKVMVGARPKITWVNRRTVATPHLRIPSRLSGTHS